MKKILMVLMGLDIGGAETHVVELSLTLKELGWDVVVASNGGIYEETLRDAGIRHVQIPSHTRAPGDMVRAYWGLKRLIEKEKPDVVHAHARIPAFICGMLQKKLKFPFVTTAHWVFHVNPLLRRLTNWGQQTIAVSEDIRTYLIDRYDLPASQIQMTVNGVDTRRFSPDKSGALARQEFSIAEDAKVIICVARFHETRSRSAFLLIESAEKLAAAEPGIRILLVGDGERMEALRQNAETVNRRLGYDCILLTGSRTDVPELIAAGDVFVGVSRSALEGMSCGKPTILCGNEGYGGLATEENARENQESNYCCRGAAAATAQKLTEDILRLLRMTPQQRKEIGMAGRELVLRNFSLMTMAKNCEKAYTLAMKPRKKVVVSGYYGYGNLGDDTILKTICDRYGQKYDLTVLSKHPVQTAKECGVTAIPRFHVGRVRKAISQCQLLISGGGSLLQDRTSTRSLLYYLAVIRMALRKNKKVMVYANGIGPIRSEKNRKRTAKTLSGVTAITLRDEDSVRELQSMGVTREDLIVTADPVFSLKPIGREEAEEMLRQAGIPEKTPLLGISLRAVSRTAAQKLSGLFDRICEQTGCAPVFLCMQPSEDVRVAEEVMGLMRVKGCQLPEDWTSEQVMSVIGCMEMVISLRLHTLIFAGAAGTPVMGFEYDPKITSLLRALDMPSLGAVGEFDIETACGIAVSALSQRETLCTRISEATAILREKERENDHILYGLMGDELEKARQRRKRIAIFQTDLHVGGIQKSLLNLVSSSVCKNCDVEIYLFEEGLFFDISNLPENIHLHFLKPFPFLFRVLPYGLVRHLVRPYPIEGTFDVAIDFNSYQHTCAYGALTVPAPKRIMWIHNDMEIKLREERKYRLLWYAMRGKYKYYTHFAAVSDGIIPPFRRCSGQWDKPIVTIPNPINTEEIWEKSQMETEIQADPDKFNLVSVGHLIHQKGFDLLLEDVRKVYEQRKDIALYIVGNGQERNTLMRQTKHLGLEDVVHFTGYLPNTFPLLRQMDAFCLESRYEGQGMVLMEAKALGLPLYFPKRLEKYNATLTGTEDMVSALVQARRTEKRFDPLEEYNHQIYRSLEQLLFLDGMEENT